MCGCIMCLFHVWKLYFRLLVRRSGKNLVAVVYHISVDMTVHADVLQGNAYLR